MLTIRRGALLCVIVGTHILVFRLVSVGEGRSAREAEGNLFVTWLVDLSRSDESRPSTYSSSSQPIPSHEPHFDSRILPDDSIAPTSGIEEAGAFIDWNAEASRVAEDAARLSSEKKEFRSLDRGPKGMGPPPPGSSLRQLGDSEHYEGGVIIDWINNRCYYSNQDAPIAAFGQALRLRTPTCTGRSVGGGGTPLPTIEEWRKERDSR